ncbi:hypothetical protein [Devosia ginsengisoli]|uniref:hypothetical protein n=1 Tax=Devosia ginsengisoli TaxID=400770 RepID=UPI0026F1444F|nr:hypothetical protein [Devosia ginsengisoli]MCR6673982.1 hypothetical protein [Devosia ginsengisoli]
MKFLTSEHGYTIITSEIGYLPLRPAIVTDPDYLAGWVAEHPLVAPNLEQLDRLEPLGSDARPELPSDRQDHDGRGGNVGLRRRRCRGHPGRCPGQCQALMP